MRLATESTPRTWQLGGFESSRKCVRGVKRSRHKASIGRLRWAILATLVQTYCSPSRLVALPAAGALSHPAHSDDSDDPLHAYVSGINVPAYAELDLQPLVAAADLVICELQQPTQSVLGCVLSVLLVLTARGRDLWRAASSNLTVRRAQMVVYKPAAG